jgi:hypothetical protein
MKKPKTTFSGFMVAPAIGTAADIWVGRLS